jgi:predicted transcriptional regulator
MTKTTVGIYIDPDTLALLDRMAEDDQRSRSNMMLVLIRQEAERRKLVKPSSPS